MTITDKQITAGGQGGSLSQEHGAGVGIMAEQMMQDAAGKTIPAGYKQTEVGVIPEDWVVYSVGDIIQRSQLGGNYENTENTSDYPLIKMGNLGRGYISLDKVEYVTSKPSSKDRLMFGDVLFNTRNTLELVGKVAVWRNELDEAYFNSNILRFYFDKDVVADSFFMNLAMNTSGFISQLSGIATGTTSVAAIYTRDLYTLKMAIPEKQEQSAIANVLSDSDALIDALEQLIAKKQAIKSATMQQLLTGRTRLPAFALRPDGTQKGYKPSELGDIPEDWVVCFLADIANLKNGYAFKSADYCSHGKYCIVTIACVQNGYMNISDSNKLNKLPFDIQSHQILTRGSLLISMTGNVGRVAKVECDDLLLNQRVGLVESKSIDRDFLFYLLRNPTFLADMEEKAVGGAQGNIGKDDILSYSLIKPVCNKEQTAIATILSDMDNELQALTQKLEKARALKQGMMQQLLTGKIRLPLAAGA
ncbi:restriction endonuclease subunit S [Aeromonas salmonicida]|nr:restriction endonuclease subunit S [Aeromonas salmonicida]EQC06345.1 restriction modification system DNA specificity domain-containing protein [Aeromonas salmonicida subsp. pectinolytica 34mel]TNI23007.1 restriction endonuclease subunit S [Aeromonas salmonicida]HEH9415322.1 restriction endonuclease subunit S [Aeromonas salmonicida]HEH9424138.1 restriction endonuclease subunit S [Aeromonas salmonicida]HEH9437384.1 restriction endonuclease subunit S [Aeromonas salmonicida]